MKKITVVIAMVMACFGLFAQSADYTKYLNQAKKYESEKRWCFALGAYYDAMATDDEPELKQEAFVAYNELKDEILKGNPGKGKYNAFTLHDEWKKLLIDAEKYGSSINKYELKIRNLVQGDLDYKTKTASYSASAEKNISDRYKRTIEIIEKGYSAGYKYDWSSDLPKPENWPLLSVSSKKDAVYNVNGALIFAIDRKNIFNDKITKEFYNAFSIDNEFGFSLYDYKFNIVDETGKEIVKAKRFLFRKEDSVNFEGITPDVMDLIDNGKAFVNPVATYLEYGKYNPLDDKGGRSFIKNFPEVTLNLNNAVFHGTNLKGDVKGKNVDSTMTWKKIAAVKERFRQFAGEFKIVEVPGQKYSMSTTEVTQKVYEAVMGDNPSKNKGENNPVESVSWYDAIYFCNMLSLAEGKTPVYSVNGNTNVMVWEYEPHKKQIISGTVEQNLTVDGYRLPTEEEWKYAAKGGQDYEYSGSDNLDEVGWYVYNSDDKTHPVAQKKANDYGLYDMSGNVFEWCWDVDPDSGDRRYYCGGSYSFFGGYSCKVSDRGNYSAGNQSYGIGFRIVCNAN